MDDSEDPRAPLLVTTPEGMVTDSNGRQQSATPEVNASIQVDDSRPSESHRRLLFRIESTGSLDNYSQSGKVTTGPVIKVTADDGDSSLVSREERLSGASLPGTLRPSKLGLPPDRKQRGSSEAPAAITGYGSISTDGMSPQTHRRHVMRKTVSGEPLPMHITHTHTHTHTHTRMHIQAHTFTRICMYLCLYMHVM